MKSGVPYAMERLLERLVLGPPFAQFGSVGVYLTFVRMLYHTVDKTVQRMHPFRDPLASFSCCNASLFFGYVIHLLEHVSLDLSLLQ